MAYEDEPENPIVPEVVRPDSRALQRREGQPTALSPFTMGWRKRYVEKENELLEATDKNQAARLRLRRSAEKLHPERLKTILNGDAAREEAEYLAAVNAGNDEVIKAKLTEERARTAELKEQAEQARLRAEIEESNAKLAKARTPHRPQTAEDEIRADFDKHFGRERAIRAEAQRRIEEVLSRSSGEVTPEVGREIKNINDWAQHKIDDL